MATRYLYHGKPETDESGNRMDKIDTIMKRLEKRISATDSYNPISFQDFLKRLKSKPDRMIRSVFQLFHDMIRYYIGEVADEYPDDPEYIKFADYDFTPLFVEGADNPYFIDRLFANRLVDLAESMKRGAQQNKIYVFDGPPGCGKSTFLNNLLMKFEEYANTEEGMCFETVWRLDRKVLGGFADQDGTPAMEWILRHLCDSTTPGGPLEIEDPDAEKPQMPAKVRFSPYVTEEYVEVPCPSHDHPLLMIPKSFRRDFLDEFFVNDQLKWKFFTEKQYEWVFKNSPCTICTSIYEALVRRLKSPMKAFQMLYARPYRFNRRLGEGISVFNPGDKPMRQLVLTNPILQQRINALLKDSNEIKYIFSRYAKTNNGIYTLMDIKSHNVERLLELHNIISEGVHKVEEIEEGVNSLFFALMNPEDKKNVVQLPSFSDRIEYIKIPYVLDFRTEVEIYRSIFGKHINAYFLPRVLENFARVIIATRLNSQSQLWIEWIEDPDKYRRYCDKNLNLLKMEIYTGNLPSWLTEEDRKKFTPKLRRKILAEAEEKGQKGFSGRDSIKIFGEFFSAYLREDRPINMSSVCIYFNKLKSDLKRYIAEGFLESLQSMYDYSVLEEVKDALYDYNEEQISRDIKNYLCAVNLEIGFPGTCEYTGEHLEATEEFFKRIEDRLLSSDVDMQQRLDFRKRTQKTYTSQTLTQEIIIGTKTIDETQLYRDLHHRYVHNIKENVLVPFLDNENFRKAIKDYNEESFKTYDNRIRNDVTFLMKNLCEKYDYTEKGAKEVCIYVIDNDLTQRFNK